MATNTRRAARQRKGRSSPSKAKIAQKVLSLAHESRARISTIIYKIRIAYTNGFRILGV
jgi:predicted transcriptional regulator